MGNPDINMGDPDIKYGPDGMFTMAGMDNKVIFWSSVTSLLCRPLTTHHHQHPPAFFSSSSCIHNVAHFGSLESNFKVMSLDMTEGF